MYRAYIGNGRYLTSEDTAEMLNISKSTLYSYVKQGLLTPIKIGRKYLFHPDELRKQLKCGSPEAVSRQAVILSKFVNRMAAKNVKVSPEVLVAVETLIEILVNNA